jgi:hypothetical protein
MAPASTDCSPSFARVLKIAAVLHCKLMGPLLVQEYTWPKSQICLGRTQIMLLQREAVGRQAVSMVGVSCWAVNMLDLLWGMAIRYILSRMRVR